MSDALLAFKNAKVGLEMLARRKDRISPVKNRRKTGAQDIALETLSQMARQTDLTILPVPMRIQRSDVCRPAGYFFAAAFFAAQRFFKAATIAAFPAALNTRFFLTGFATFGAFVSA